MAFKILVLDGSLGGRNGNTGALVRHFLAALPDGIEADYVELREVPDVRALEARMLAADGFVLASGTYWQSWGSPMQRFFEQATHWEVSGVWLGKPACTLVTMHSVGGMEVLARMQATLNLLGAYVPPLGGMVYSLVNNLLVNSDLADDEADVWGLEDLRVVAQNFQAALKGEKAQAAWEIDAQDAVTRRWLK